MKAELCLVQEIVRAVVSLEQEGAVMRASSWETLIDGHEHVLSLLLSTTPQHQDRLISAVEVQSFASRISPISM